jgi:Sigma-70, region 4
VIQEYVPAVDDGGRAMALARHRMHLAQLYTTLPTYGSVAYWRSVEETDMHRALPLEVIVKCIRASIGRGDIVGRKRTFEILFRRIATSNEHWANNVLKARHFATGEQVVFVYDLYADICEGVMRAVIDPNRLFWEENFLHCLRFERRHVYETFMQQEGRWIYSREKKGDRVPRRLIASIDQPEKRPDADPSVSLLEDEMARKALLAVEHSDLPRLIVSLPDKLKAVVLLIFWEDRTEKDTARLLCITDRTVRYRLKRALRLLYRILEAEREMLHE